jgi:hypothetical protein
MTNEHCNRQCLACKNNCPLNIIETQLNYIIDRKNEIKNKIKIKLSNNYSALHKNIALFENTMDI